MKKYALYTAVYGVPGKKRSHQVFTTGVDKICYTDIKDFTFSDYQIKQMDLSHIAPTSVKRQRYSKICIPDEIFYNYEYSLYADRKYSTNADFDWLLWRLGPDSDFLVSKHKGRDCLYDEGMKCVEAGKGDKESIFKQLDFYKNDGYPINNGLYATGWLFRRHTKKLKEAMSSWWMEVKKYSERDQVSLPYVIWKHDINISLNMRYLSHAALKKGTK